MIHKFFTYTKKLRTPSILIANIDSSTSKLVLTIVTINPRTSVATVTNHSKSLRFGSPRCLDRSSTGSRTTKSPLFCAWRPSRSSSPPSQWPLRSRTFRMSWLLVRMSWTQPCRVQLWLLQFQPPIVLLLG